jgi:hypothetical protein
MARKLKLTGLARFVIVMAILAPLAFVGASYYNGQDGIQNLKNLIGITDGGGTTTTTISADRPSDNADLAELESMLNELKTKVEELEQENKELKATLYEKDLQIKELQGE